jgi:PASTA domain
VGLSFDRARSRLTRFSVERAERPRTERSSAPEGQVVEQSPRAASRATAGSVIVLTVSSAPRAAVEIFEMPNVVGRADADAARSLAEFNVSRSAIASAEPRGRIVAQTPAPGATLLPGDSVSLQISAGSGAASTATGEANAAAMPPVLPSASAVAEEKTGRGVFRGVLAVSTAVVLGLIVGALLMRQWLLRQRAVAAADDVITSMSPAPPVTTVDILLEEETAEPNELVDDLPVEPPSLEPQEKDAGSSDEQEKHPGS